MEMNERYIYVKKAAYLIAGASTIARREEYNHIFRWVPNELIEVVSDESLAISPY